MKNKALWWVSLGTACCLFTGVGIGRFGYTVMVPAMVNAGLVSETEAGYLGAFNLLGYLLGSLAAPRLMRHFGSIPLLKACMVVALVCLLVSAVPGGFWWLLPWRVLIGLAAGVLMVGAVTVLLTLASAEELPTAAASLFTGVGTGIMLSGILVPPLSGMGVAAAWLGLTALVGIAIALAWWSFPARLPSTDPGPSIQVRGTVLSAGVVRLLLAHLLFGMGIMPHTIYWVDYIARTLDRGMGTAGLSWTLVGIGAFVGPMICGLLARNIGFSRGLVLAMAALALGLLLPNMTGHAIAFILSSILFGVFNTGMSTLMSGRTRELSEPATLARVWGWMAIAISVGQVIGGYAIVLLFEATSRIESVFLFGTAVLVLGMLVSLDRGSKHS